MIRILWIFYKSLFLMNVAFSVVLSMSYTLFLYSSASGGASFPFFKLFLHFAMVFFMTGGLALSIGYSALYKKKQYSFFHNHAMTEVKLIASALLINTVIGAVLLIIISYA